MWLRLVGLVDRSGRAVTPGGIPVTIGICWRAMEFVGKLDRQFEFSGDNMGVIKDVYKISIDISKFAITQFQVGLKKREIKLLLTNCLATAALPTNIDQILDEAEKIVGKNEINTKTLRRISTSVKETSAKRKPAARKKVAAKKRPAAKKRVSR